MNHNKAHMRGLQILGQIKRRTKKELLKQRVEEHIAQEIAMKAKLEALCCCGHVFEDHKAKHPHACTCESKFRLNYDCPCKGFQARFAVPDNDRSVDKTLASASGAADRELNYVLKSIPQNMDN
jgi:hypothetical protein